MKRKIADEVILRIKLFMAKVFGQKEKEKIQVSNKFKTSISCNKNVACLFWAQKKIILIEFLRLRRDLTKPQESNSKQTEEIVDEGCVFVARQRPPVHGQLY